MNVTLLGTAVFISMDLPDMCLAVRLCLLSSFLPSTCFFFWLISLDFLSFYWSTADCATGSLYHSIFCGLLLFSSFLRWSCPCASHCACTDNIGLQSQLSTCRVRGLPAFVRGPWALVDMTGSRVYCATSRVFVRGPRGFYCAELAILFPFSFLLDRTSSWPSS
jgi:hypothetical protein